MTMRTSRRTVTFARPFSLRGIETEQPAGTYAVETDEELLEGLSFPAYWQGCHYYLPDFTAGRPGLGASS